MTRQIIGVGGLKTAGKDVVADYLVREHGFVKIGMSDALLEALLVLNPIVDYDYEGKYTFSSEVRYWGYNEAKARNPEVRRLLQVFGTDVARNLLDEYIWVDKVWKRIEELPPTQNVVVTGIRFPNELVIAHENWYVERPGLLNDGHESEQLEPRQFDRCLINDGTITDLENKVATIMG